MADHLWNTPDSYESFHHARVESSHSGLGIASFILSLLAGLALFACFVVAAVMETQTPGGLDETSVEAMVIGLCMFAFMGVAVLGIGLGIAGVLQEGRSKIFAILGIVFSAAALVSTIGLITLGLMAESA